jgi:hypothetical protein
MSTNQEIPLQQRFAPASFDAHEKEIIVGALNRYGIGNLAPAVPDNLSIFTWDQVQQALILSRRDCFGDSRDDVDDVIYNLMQERKSYVN